MSSSGYSLPATAICPGCGTMVTLPPQALPISPPAISPTPTAFGDLPPESRKLSRGGLFRSLGGMLAERAEDAVENAKSHFDK